MGTSHEQMRTESSDEYSTNTFQYRITDDQIRDVYRFMYRQVGNREAAEDLTQRACLRAMRVTAHTAANAPDAATHQPLADVLWQSADRVIEEYLRWFYNATSVTDIYEPAPEHADATIAHALGTPDRVQRTFAQLPAQDRDLLTSRFLRNASLPETAASMSMTVGEARVLQYVALFHAAQIMARDRAPAEPVPCGSSAGPCADDVL